MAVKKLIASSGSLEGILKMIKKFYYSPSICFVFNGTTWAVYNSKGVIDGVHVVKKHSRYRFENK